MKRKPSKEDIKRYNKTYKDKTRSVVLKAKDKPCADCGIQYPPCAMEFDHVIGTKLFDIGGNGSWKSLPKLLAEIEKCDVVCANCHAMRTHDC